MLYIFLATLLLTILLIVGYIRHLVLEQVFINYRRSRYNLYLTMTLVIFFLTLASLSVTAYFTMTVLGLDEIALAMERPIDWAALVLVPIGMHTLIRQIKLEKKLKPILHPNDRRRRFGVYVMTFMTTGFLILTWLLYVRLVEAAWLIG